MLSDAFYQSYLEEREMESSYHFFLYCPAFARLSLKYFSRHNFGESRKLAGIHINRFNKFVVSSKRIVGL